MSPDKAEELGTAIAEAKQNSIRKGDEILTRSQAKLSDLEREVQTLQQMHREVREAVMKNQENLDRLALLIEQDKVALKDLENTITANLSAIDALRRAGISLPDSI